MNALTDFIFAGPIGGPAFVVCGHIKASLAPVRNRTPLEKVAYLNLLEQRRQTAKHAGARR